MQFSNPETIVMQDRQESDIRQQLLQQVDQLPESLLVEVLDFVLFVKDRHHQQSETTLLSEPALQQDWLKPEEDEAWQDL